MCKTPLFVLPITFLIACSGTPESSESSETATEQRPPNIIFIMADDLGYGDLGSYGQEMIQTPRLDSMAAQGMRFTNFYAGNTVCAPSRSVLMTGKHMGRTRVRGNASGQMKQSLADESVTLASMLKGVGYQNALIGKWGLGEIDQPGMPLEQGFDYFFGYLNQVHAHNHFPEFLWRNRDSVQLDNEVQPVPRAYSRNFVGGYATKKVEYSQDLFAEEALSFIEKQKNEPFFLYLALVVPHANNEAGSKGQEVPDYGIYADKDWPEPQKGTAAMISRMDADIGEMMDALKQHGIDENTIMFFTSDNGPHSEGGNDPQFFDSNGSLQGIKRDLTEGGIRVPLIARWPGQIPANTTTDHIGYFGDMMATFADLAGTKAPDSTQSISIVPVLTGTPSEQQTHDYLYWEFYEQGSRQAVRFGKWKAIREPMFTGNIQLYNLEEDIGESNDLAEQYPERVEEARAMMEEAHQPSPLWSVNG